MGVELIELRTWGLKLFSREESLLRNTLGNADARSNGSWAEING